MLKENDFVKVHLYGCSNKEIKTGNYNKVFRVYRKNGVLGIDWNTSRSLYTNHKIKIFKIILDNQTIIKYNTINNKQHNFKFKNTEDQEK